MPKVRLIDANALEQFYECGTDPDDTYADMTYIRAEHIENAPTIEPEVLHGLWVSEKVRKRNWKGVEHDYFQPNSCSVCHTGFAVRTNFCPNCGARMDGGAENA